MISFQFDGRAVYANVFEYRHSPAVYHVQFIDYVTPTHLILHETDGDIVAEDAPGLDPRIVELVIAAIKRNPNRI